MGGAWPATSGVKCCVPGRNVADVRPGPNRGVPGSRGVPGTCPVPRMSGAALEETLRAGGGAAVTGSPGGTTLSWVSPSPDPRRTWGRADVTDVEIIGGTEKRALVIEEYDERWPARFLAERMRIAEALGRRAGAIEHIGSTSVPGLAAKPIIDILVTVWDITAEEEYLPSLAAAGYDLRVREPGHRMMRTPARDVHVHILEAGHPDVDAYLVFRDRLRADDADRKLYERTKRELARHDWSDMNAYAEAKTDVVRAIKARADAAPSPPSQVPWWSTATVGPRAGAAARAVPGPGERPGGIHSRPRSRTIPRRPGTSPVEPD